jgi:RNA polymerase sporulation-specific sigma factor
LDTYSCNGNIGDNELVSRAKAGDSVALSVLIEKYSNYIYKKASSFKNLCGIDAEDLYQEGMIGFVSSIYSFDENFGTKFSTYSSTIYSRKMLSAIRKTNSCVGNCVDYFTSIDEENVTLQHPSPEEAVLYNEEINEILDFVKLNFSKTEQKVFKLILLGASYSEIAEILDCNKKSVDNAVQRIRKKLRASRE